MKISFKKALRLLLAADQVTISNGDTNELVSICTAGVIIDMTYFTVLWESESGEDFTYDVYANQNVKVEKKGHTLKFISSDDSDNEVIELALFKVTPLV
jgi:hypothetical protein